MKIELEVSGAVVGAIVEAMKREGLAVPAEGRMAPFSVEELVLETGISETGVRRLIESGALPRIEGVGRVLVPVNAVRQWQEGKRKSAVCVARREGGRR
jgi:hypothetical protein